VNEKHTKTQKLQQNTSTIIATAAIHILEDPELEKLLAHFRHEGVGDSDLIVSHGVGERIRNR